MVPDTLLNILGEKMYRKNNTFFGGTNETGSSAEVKTTNPASGTPHKEILILAIDFDGCVYNEQYKKEISRKRNENPDMTWGVFLQQQNALLQSENQHLFNDVKTKIQQLTNVTKIEIYCGSARQSYKTDTINLIHGPDIYGSAMQGLVMLRNMFENEISKCVVEANRFMLADVYGGHKPGESFQRALIQMDKDATSWRANTYKSMSVNPKDYEHSFNDHPDWLFDESKITIVYAHIHKIARDNPEATITYSFYDDRQELLEAIGKFFGSHLDLVPKNITITLNRYDGQQVKYLTVNLPGKEFPALKGEGETDLYYDESIKMMAKLSTIDVELFGSIRIYNLSEQLSIEQRLSAFKEWREKNLASEEKSLQHPSLVCGR